MTDAIAFVAMNIAAGLAVLGLAWGVGYWLGLLVFRLIDWLGSSSDAYLD